MNIEKSVLDSLTKMGFESPTRIQEETIPLIKQGHDVIGQSETGSGKTGAFGIPLVETAKKGGGIQALVLAPTRELSVQIASELKKFSHFKGLFIQEVYGGVSMGPQFNGLQRAEIVVGTPGRVLDHLKRGSMNTRKIKIFVLDEADKLIDMGFEPDIWAIERFIPKNRQTLLFSATMPTALEKIRDRFTKDAKKILTETKVSEDLLKQYYVDVDQKQKFSMLVHLINQEKGELAIIFCNSRRDANSIASNLQRNGISAEALHGGLTQQMRERVLSNFHQGTTRVLVATDVASRGLDIRNVTHIFNFSVPKFPEDYVNRIGRTARAGESGKVISLLTRDDHNSFRKILRDSRSEIEKIPVENFRILPFELHSREERDFGHRRFGQGRFGQGPRGSRRNNRENSFGRRRHRYHRN